MLRHVGRPQVLEKVAESTLGSAEAAVGYLPPPTPSAPHKDSSELGSLLSQLMCHGGRLPWIITLLLTLHGSRRSVSIVNSGRATILEGATRNLPYSEHSTSIY